MKKKALLLAPAVALGLTAMAAGPAMADHAEGSYATTFTDINQTGASGGAWIDINGSEATVKVEAAGLAPVFNDGPYPHVQHIHIGAQGTCPTIAEHDENGDGIVSTVEGMPAYGEIGSTLSTSGSTGADTALSLELAPAISEDGSFVYERTFEMNEATQDALADGTGVVVVHGLDPADLGEEAAAAMSELNPDLPLAATAPALCGDLAMQPVGGADTGAAAAGNADDGVSELGMVGLGAGLLAAAGGAYALRRTASAKR